MRALFIPVVSAVLLFGSCASQKMSRNESGNYDDVYYSSNDAQAEQTTPAQSYESATPSENYSQAPEQNSRFEYDQSTPAPYSTTEERDGNTYITNNYYGDDDYYDYAYASRVRRFHTDVTFGYGYYDSYFTNAYWYDYNPYSYGVSIYLGYSWWTPHYQPYYNYCYTPYSYYGYNPWYSPYAYNTGYYQGYNNGYWNGYYDGMYGGCYNPCYNPCYFNSYDNTSYYNGPRRENGSNLTANASGHSVGELYQNNVLQNSNHTPSSFANSMNSGPSNSNTVKPVSSTPGIVKSDKAVVGGSNSQTIVKSPTGTSGQPGKTLSGQSTVVDSKGNTSGSGNGDVKPSANNPSGFSSVPPKNNNGTVSGDSKPSANNPSSYSSATPKNNNGTVKGNTQGAVTPKGGNAGSFSDQPVNNAPDSKPATSSSPAVKGSTYQNSGNTRPVQPSYQNPRTNSKPSSEPSGGQIQSEPKPRNSYQQPSKPSRENSSSRPRSSSQPKMNQSKPSAPANNNNYQSAPSGKSIQQSSPSRSSGGSFSGSGSSGTRSNSSSGTSKNR